MAYVKQNWADGESFVNADRMNHLEDGVAALSGFGVGVPLSENVTTDPLNIGLKTGWYGLWSGKSGTINLPESGDFIGYCQVVHFDNYWHYVYAYNINTQNAFVNRYTSITNAWEGWHSPGAVKHLSRASTNIFFSDDGYISCGGTISATNRGGPDWNITIEVEYTVSTPAADYYNYGVNKSVLTEIIGKNLSFVNYDLANRWELYSVSGTMHRDLMQYGTTLENDTKYLRPARIYSIDGGGGFGAGSWGLNLLPTTGYFKLDFWGKEA